MGKINRALGATLDRDELLEITLQYVIDTMKVKGASLFLMDEESDEFVRVAVKGLSEEYVRSGLTRPQKLAPILLKEGYLFARDAYTDPRLEHHRVKKAEGITSILVAPVMVKGKIIGGLSLFSESPREFSEDEIDFLTALAEQGGMAVEHARLFHQLKENTRVFLDLAASINASLEVEKVLHILTENVAEAVGVKAAAIRLLNEDERTLEIAASYGLSEAYLQKGPVSAVKGPDRELIEGKPLILRNALTDKGVHYRKEMKQEGIVSILSVPIKTRKKVIGILRLYSAVLREFTKDDIMLITALAQIGGLAIEHSRLFRQLKNNTKMFLHLAASINSSLEVDKVLHILTANVAEALGVKAAAIRLLDDDKKLLKLVASYGLSEKYLNKGAISAEKGPDRELILGKPLILRNALTDKGITFKKEMKEEGIASILSVPMSTKDEVIGVLRLYSGVPREFSEEEIMLVMALAHHGGLAIQNASLYMMLKEDMDDLRKDMWSHRSWF